ncbi:class I SAM-dependent methyltransferase [Pseudemcibacter aquimaris]|uniref:class I SAM-dependent methyltransferase n=1 Tax=Pseudemcibacter aquimaris TaxID=2857064 RepID=UPI0020135E4E|nr:class I SAM-dependent methyltransferase [Pseudemcibacter aquimaris]MCC3861455.1 class I SAM-dependent methyltransferase [Pseudemcibacter aquimaris]WDU58224.1 class I SAM-dependent methyltransferase [Pseudemcibacter aquimaris]
MNTMAEVLAFPDYDTIKKKQNAAWGAGNYSLIGSTLQLTGEELAERMDLRPGSAVLDIAAGNGNASLAFARRFCNVTSTDYVDTHLISGQERALAEGLDIHYMLADAENLMVEYGTYDAVVSTFGAMFAPNQEKAASEMIRACKRGGKIGMANWTPDSFFGQLFNIINQFVIPPQSVKSPALWGTGKWIGKNFGRSAKEIVTVEKQFFFRYPTPHFFIDFFRKNYGPVHKAFLILNPDGQDKLEKEILALINKFNIAKDGTMKVPSEYLEVVITKE